ncbi:MAG: hypothetical protein U5K72_16045 [Balneolaceae bacterium]|nr:hypothetical protein [Balneolaceae bacterium]
MTNTDPIKILRSFNDESTSESIRISTNTDKILTKKSVPSKIAFIQELLKSKILDLKHKEKILDLVSEEVKNLENDQNSVKEDVEIIKRKIQEFEKRIDNNKNISNEISTSSAKTEKEKNKINLKTHKPKEFADFMQLFNARDGFKYLTHDFDKVEIFDIENFLNKTEKLFNSKTKKLKIPKNYLDSNATVCI